MEESIHQKTDLRLFVILKFLIEINVVLILKTIWHIKNLKEMNIFK